ncbi:MarR family winged helix-turn-helix transcriptional regulator [Paenibacillus ginsengihumi]|jgi:DNA-binding MarR family transcriptional regulator|uniref:MarR family winged helix-turn-helix transcriptional regulator n=1 Tax=Paenibacillus ginsengihumi TaxID=431596 RepID=UPI00035E3BD3|nr:MarR family winged helix-turn-helix transcriptional regulator [Paenibacillus ginsengihumi]
MSLNDTESSQVGPLLRQLTKMYQGLMLKDLKDLGLTPPQMFTLMQVMHEPKTIGEISRSIHLSYSTVSGIIDRLEREELLERVRDETDRRIIWIQKTKKFDENKEKLSLLKESFFEHLFDDLSEQELKEIVRALRTLVCHLQAKMVDEQ